MKEIIKRLKEVCSREVFNFGMPVSDEELSRRIIEDINRYREREVIVVVIEEEYLIICLMYMQIYRGIVV